MIETILYMAALFIAAPEEVTPLLSSTMRSDMVDLIVAGAEANVSNRMGEESEMLMLTDDYALVKLSESSRLEIKALPRTKGDTLLAVIHTVAGPAADSRIEFYDTRWQKAKKISLPTLSVSDFFAVGEVPDSLADVAEQLADLPLVELRASADGTDIVATLSTWPVETQKKGATNDLVRPVVLSFDGRRRFTCGSSRSGS